MANLLSSARLYVEQVPEDLDAIYSPGKRRGKRPGKRMRQADSKPAKDFIHGCNRQRASFAYCAMHALRDYAQHCGIPVHDAVYHFTRDNMDPGSPYRVGLQLFVDVDRLALDPLFDQGVLRKLKRQADRYGCVELTPWVSEYMEKLCTVHESLRARIAADVAAWDQTIIGMLDRARAAFGDDLTPVSRWWRKSGMTKGTIWMVSSRTSRPSSSNGVNNWRRRTGTSATCPLDTLLGMRIAHLSRKWTCSTQTWPRLTLVANAWGRPASEATQANKNTALLYASYRVLNSLLPKHAEDWREMLRAAGLDPDDRRRDLSSPIGIGNRAGAAVAAAREHDGMNQLGDEGGRIFNRVPYADYSGYRPVNTAYRLRDPSRWQPQVISDGSGVFRVQQFVTPQLGVTRPYSYTDPDRFRVPPPHKSMLHGRHGRAAYRAQADEVLAASAALDDRRKLIVELVDDKIRSLGFSALFASQSRGLSLDEFVQYDFLTNLAAFDAAIAVWSEKVRHDAVRPISAIRYLYGDRPVRAWGGPGRGTVDRIPASQWKSYVQTADHAEYPSGSAAFCAAHAQASRRFLGSDELGWTGSFP